ncbi:hypothetical protein QN277_012352 [Acacia crassicarpa]|uniref:Protein kinase domain-containing protein n=1 Tax=Acacia crassicarpa TaxID=499986 RepID=A0AAE1TEI5_9FABA|nr:hypothetical protein QN277_012352 [Acacia crassicarpa]
MLFLTFFFLSSFPLFHCQPDNEYRDCQPSPYCGKVGNISYPFWSEESCQYVRSSEFKLNCPQHKDDYPSIQIGSQTFNVTHIDLENHIMTLMRTDFAYDDCSSQHLSDTSVSTPFNAFQYDEPSVKNVTIFYNCSSDYSTVGFEFACQPPTSYDSHSKNYAFSLEYVVHEPQFPDLIKNCKRRIQVPVSIEPDVQPQSYSQILKQALDNGWFRVKYNKVDESSHSSGEIALKNKIIVVGAPTPEAMLRKQRGISIKNKVIVGVVIAVVVTGAIGLLLLCTNHCCSKITSWRQRIGLDKTSKVDQNIEAFIKNHGSLALTRYKFGDVKKMTNTFKDKLGQGGYGSVYQGKLLNGQPIAVKLLKASQENGEDFINELASISRTSHVNVVTLLGFCFEGKQKALIYEFMPNGSLDKFIHNNIDKNNICLTWEKLYQIAIGIARGLEYLHRGCNIRIVHFDIKPHNILLDESFCPKISDFGLAKLCPKKESVISISEARGTIGYLAPKVWNRNIGGVSHKSDVYSYGMMLLDMVGGRKNVNVETKCSTDKYFPDYIYDQLEQDNSLGCNGANNVEENELAKRMTIVSLWCIQTFPNQRPPMSRVIEMFERRLDLLEMPPKPVISSPPRLELESSTTTNTTT